MNSSQSHPRQRPTSTRRAGPIVVRLAAPHPSMNLDQVMAHWGIPTSWDFDGLPTATHHGNAGEGVFRLPLTCEVVEFASRMRRRKMAHPLLILLGYLVLLSELPLDESVQTIEALREMDPVVHHPIAAEEWDEIAELGRVVRAHRGTCSRLARVRA